MKIYFSTVVRGAPIEQGGEIVLLDWQTKTINAKVSVVPSNPEIVDPNPRGNARGGRGIGLVDGKVIVANYHTLQIFDHSLHHQIDISHPLMVGIHEILPYSRDKLLVCSTTIDAVIGINLSTSEMFQQYWPRESISFQNSLNIVPLQIDKQLDNRVRFLDKKHVRHPSHLHLNAVAIWQGETYALFNTFGVVANLDQGQIVIQDKTLKHAHNLIISESGIAFVNNTFARATHIYDLHSKKLVRSIKLTSFELVKRLIVNHTISYYIRGGLKKLSSRRSAPRPVFVRGLDKHGDFLFVGISPATILCINWKTGKLVDYYSYSNDVAVCVHGLKVLME